MDGTQNHAPRIYGFEEFPTIYWAPMGNKQNPKKYEGPKDQGAFLSFIRKEAGVKLRVKDFLYKYM